MGSADSAPFTKAPPPGAGAGCDYGSVEKLNSLELCPLLGELVQQPFFRYFKVNLYCDCPFWPDDGMCSLRDCSVCECEEGEVPRPWTDAETHPPPPVACESAGTPARAPSHVPSAPQTLPELHPPPSVPCGSMGTPGRAPSRVQPAPQTLPRSTPGSPTQRTADDWDPVGPPTPSKTIQSPPSAVTRPPDLAVSESGNPSTFVAQAPHDDALAQNPIFGDSPSQTLSLPSETLPSPSETLSPSEDVSGRWHPPPSSPAPWPSAGVPQPPSVTSGHVSSPAPSQWVSLEARNVTGDAVGAHDSSVTAASGQDTTGWGPLLELASCGAGNSLQYWIVLGFRYMFLKVSPDFPEFPVHFFTSFSGLPGFPVQISTSFSGLPSFPLQIFSRFFFFRIFLGFRYRFLQVSPDFPGFPVEMSTSFSRSWSDEGS
jgi:hypothetical protein